MLKIYDMAIMYRMTLLSSIIGLINLYKLLSFDDFIFLYIHEVSIRLNALIISLD